MQSFCWYQQIKFPFPISPSQPQNNLQTVLIFSIPLTPWLFRFRWGRSSCLQKKRNWHSFIARHPKKMVQGGRGSPEVNLRAHFQWPVHSLLVVFPVFAPASCEQVQVDGDPPLDQQKMKKVVKNQKKNNAWAVGRKETLQVVQQLQLFLFSCWLHVESFRLL